MRFRHGLSITAWLFVTAVGGYAQQQPALETVVHPEGPVRSDWLPDTPTILHWHWQKSRFGPALTGNESWRHFMDFLETELARRGVVDIERNAWSFRRWQTSHWPDASGWSLSVDGVPVSVSSFGANSGTTPPNGITARLALYDPDRPTKGLHGKIAVLRAAVPPETAKQLAAIDHEYRAPSAPYPWPVDPRPVRWQHRDSGNPESVSWKIFPQLMQTPGLLKAARDGGAVGALLVFDAGQDLAAGLYTFPVPELYDVPTLILDRESGAQVIAAAEAGASATLRLESEVVDSEAYQLIGFLPGRDYGTEADEVIQLVTHTDGPSISQDNGALGLLALLDYFTRIPQANRSRTLMVFLDCRHFMPGQEHAFGDKDYFARYPDARRKLFAVVGMEHLGQIEYVEREGRLVPSGWTDPSMVWTTDHTVLQEAAKMAIIGQGLPSAVLRNVWRDGIHGRNQGSWYGMASPKRIGGLPAVAVMGTMGAYWATSSGMDRLDPELFRRQVAAFIQITAELMEIEAGQLSAKPPLAPAPASAR